MVLVVGALVISLFSKLQYTLSGGYWSMVLVVGTGPWC